MVGETWPERLADGATTGPPNARKISRATGCAGTRIAIVSSPAVARSATTQPLLFGSTKLPKLARSLGQAQKEFKSGMDDPDKGDKDEKQEAKQGGETVTMSKADLDALIAEREAKARGEAVPPSD